MTKYGPAPLPIQPEPLLEEKACIVTFLPGCYEHQSSHRCCAYCEKLYKCQERCTASWLLWTHPRRYTVTTFQCKNMRTIPQIVWDMLLTGGSDIY